MCIIIGKLKGVELPDYETLYNCSQLNKDGIGIAWTTGDGVVKIKKDFDNNFMFNRWLRENIDKDRDSAIIHYRMATCGKKDHGNAHPFPVTKDRGELRKVETVCEMAVAHNGVIAGLGDDKYSDTQELVAEILAEPLVLNNLLKNAVLRKLLTSFIGTSRLFFLLGDGTIWHFGAIEKENELIYSNKNYKRAYKEYDSNYFKGRKWDYATNQWVDEDDKDLKLDSLLKAMDKKDDGKKGQIVHMVMCFYCEKMWDSHKLFKIRSKATQQVLQEKICGKCYYDKDRGFKTGFDRLSERDEILSISDAKSEISKGGEVYEGLC